MTARSATNENGQQSAGGSESLIATRRQPQTMGFTALRKWLRHRHPMILLDRISDYEPGHFLSAMMSVSGNVDVIAGHFPERAIYPGSHLLQAFSQAGIILYGVTTSPIEEDELTLVTSLEARFFKIVVPGDQIVIDVSADRVLGNTFKFSGKATVGTARIGAFRATLARVKAEDLGPMHW